MCSFSRSDKFLKVQVSLGEALRSKILLFSLKVLLLSSVILGLQVWIPKVASQPFYYYPDVTLDPSFPTIFENISITMSFYFTSDPPHVEEFGSLARDGNTFTVNVTIFVPAPWEVVLPIVHTDSYTFSLGNLSGGEYEFQVIILHIHYTDGSSYL